MGDFLRLILWECKVLLLVYYLGLNWDSVKMNEGIRPTPKMGEERIKSQWRSYSAIRILRLVNDGFYGRKS
jgi:hypothetical protein